MPLSCIGCLRASAQSAVLAEPDYSRTYNYAAEPFASSEEKCSGMRSTDSRKRRHLLSVQIACLGQPRHRPTEAYERHSTPGGRRFSPAGAAAQAGYLEQPACLLGDWFGLACVLSLSFSRNPGMGAGCYDAVSPA